MSTEVILAVVGAISGGFGLKLIEYFTENSQRNFDTKTLQRNELVTRVTALEIELKETRKEAAIATQNYYETKSELARTTERLKYVEEELTECKEENARLKTRIAELERK